MSLYKNLKPDRVFKYFEEICAIPHGSGDMDAIADYCVSFAKQQGLDYFIDDAKNVVIYKPATKGYENSEPVILQGHLDMVCQKTDDSDIDFLNDGIKVYADGDFLKAKGTTLGADNGIAVSMVLAILESDEYSHPPIEAVFTTDEEIGMLGAAVLDMSKLKGKRMINIDSEEEDTLTVSCAGGSDFKVEFPLKRETLEGTEIIVTLSGLKGGHSGVEINKGRVNANMLAGRFLNHMKNSCDFSIISINGGDKGNAITNNCKIELCVFDADVFLNIAKDYLEIIKLEFSARESDFCFNLEVNGKQSCNVIAKSISDEIIHTCLCAPGGVVEMSAEIEGLVETSLNMGVLQTYEDKTVINFALRSNKSSALRFLEEKLFAFFKNFSCKTEVSGHYPPWEFNAESKLQGIYSQAYKEQFGKEPKIEAIHAGLECGIFSSEIEGIDCIALGPQMYDVHTVNERLSISSTERIFALILKILEKC